MNLENDMLSIKNEIDQHKKRVEKVEELFTIFSNLVDSIQKYKYPDDEKEFWVLDKKTGKEADPYNIALHEDWAKELCYCDMEGFAITEDGELILMDECGRCKYCEYEMPGRFVPMRRRKDGE